MWMLYFTMAIAVPVPQRVKKEIYTARALSRHLLSILKPHSPCFLCLWKGLYFRWFVCTYIVNVVQVLPFHIFIQNVIGTQGECEHVEWRDPKQCSQVLCRIDQSNPMIILQISGWEEEAIVVTSPCQDVGVSQWIKLACVAGNVGLS